MKNKRKKYLINPKFQLSFIAYHVLVAVSVCSVFYFAVRIFFWKMHQFGLEAGLAEGHVFFQFIDEQVYLMNFIFVICSMLTVAGLSLHGLFFSHKIAGPLYKLHRHMSDPTGKDLEPVYFRKTDYFREIETAYNEHVERINNPQRRKHA